MKETRTKKYDNPDLNSMRQMELDPPLFPLEKGVGSWICETEAEDLNNEPLFLITGDSPSLWWEGLMN